MKIESPHFTMADLRAFADDVIDHERRVTAARIEAASNRLAVAVARISAPPETETDTWNARDVLAHIAVFSKFYGVLAYKVGSGQISEINLLENIQQRDVIAADVIQRPPEVLLRAIQSDHRRTVEYLRSTDAAAMQRTVDIGGQTLTVDYIVRLPLCAHLEMHVEQLVQVLGD